MGMRLILMTALVLLSGCVTNWLPRKVDCGCFGQKEKCNCCNRNVCVTEPHARLAVFEVDF